MATLTTALDIGCEAGRWSKLLADFGWKLLCTDVNQADLDICQKRLPTAKCIHVTPDDTKLSCDDESMALLLCIGVPPVIHADWFLDEATRVVQKDGIVVGVVWNRSSWRGWLYHALPVLRIKGSGQWYWFPFPYAQWKKRFCAKGFSMLYEEGYSWIPFRRSSNSPLVPFTAHIERLLGLRKLVNLSPMVIFIARKER